MASIEKAQRVIEVTNTTKTIDILLDQYLQQMRADFATADEDVSNVVIETIKSVFADHRQAFLDIIASGFVRIFTDDELDALADFYESPIGRSIISKQDVVSQTNSQEVFAYNRSVVLPQMQKQLVEALEELEKSRESGESEDEASE